MPDQSVSLPSAAFQSATPPRPSSGARRLPVGAKRPLDHGGRRRQGGLHVAVLEPAREQDVVGRLVVDEGRGPARVSDVHDGGQRLVIDGDEPGRVLGQVPVGGDDGGHGLAA